MADDFITVKVGSMYYRVTGGADPAYVQKVAQQANDLLAEIKSRHPGLSDLAASVLALLNSIDRGWKLESGDCDADQDLQAKQAALDQAQAEILHLREQVWDIKKDALYYRNLCEMYEERLNSMPPKTANSTPKTGGDKLRPLDLMQTSFEDLTSGPIKTKD
ncbi:MAG: cell division protein ZapA [Eubacteriales bacterium]|nr:cell division protein ZapA [Clostridiales bacterium]MDY5836909.1 cell division protein ZapA [Eubacteriales bacterium]